MAKPKAQLYVLKIGDYERHEITLSPADAARAATQIAKGTFDRAKSMWEQPSNAKPGRAVKLYDEAGTLLMACRPELRARSSRATRVKRTFAACEITPSFKKKIAKQRRRR